MDFRTWVRLPSAPYKKDLKGSFFVWNRESHVKKIHIDFRTWGAKGPGDLCPAPTGVKRRPTLNLLPKGPERVLFFDPYREYN